MRYALFTLAILLACLSQCRAGEVLTPAEGKFLSNARPLTSDFVRAGEGYFSPDMQTIIYQAAPKDYPFYQIYTQPLADGTAKRVSTGRGRTTCSYFAPNGRKIIFASSHLDPHLEQTDSCSRERSGESPITRRPTSCPSFHRTGSDSCGPAIAGPIVRASFGSPIFRCRSEKGERISAIRSNLS